MSGARALTNLIGNGVACIAVARWDGALDARRMRKVLDGETVLEADAPEEVLIAHETVAARR
jgi:aerobic C4-dicarboxylate transport protein